MAFFPNLSNFDKYIATELDRRKGNIEYVSNKNAWFKVASGTKVKINESLTFNGVVMESNPTNLWNFAENEKSAYGRLGSENTSFLSGQALSGTIGHELGNPSVRVQVGGRYYRPRPSIESISVKHGTRGLSRQAEFQIKCYSLEQLEVISKFFLEPGNIVFMEWGWNTSNSAKESILHKSNKETVIRNIIDQFNYTKLSNRRVNSGGSYDNFVGYITGGDIQSSGDSYIVSVKLTSVGELAAYLRTQNGTNTLGESKGNTGITFSKKEIEDDDVELGKRQFRIMFNKLPTKFQTQRVKNLQLEIGTEIELINFDDERRKEISSDWISSTKTQISAGLAGSSVAGFFGLGSKSAIEDSVIYSSNELIDSNSFIRFGSLMKVIRTVSKDLNLNINGTRISNLYIDIENTRLNSFDRIFSTNNDILFIPNSKLPDFGVRKFVQDTLSDEPSGSFKNIGTRILEDKTAIVDASLQGVEFPESVDFSKTFNNESTDKDPVIVKHDKRTWGYLKNLYINFDYAMNILNTADLSQTDWLYRMLNGISSAANNLWDFEIIERYNETEKIDVPEASVGTVPTLVEQIDVANNQQNSTTSISKGTYTVQVIEKNTVGSISDSGVYEFYNIGEQSILLEGNFNLDIPGAMMNQVVAKRSSPNLDVNGQGQNVVDGIFTEEGEVDALLKLKMEETTPTEIDPDESKPSEKFAAFTKYVGIVPKQSTQSNGIDDSESIKSLRESIAITYNNSSLFRDLMNVDSFELGTKISPVLLPIRFSFKIHGISGIKVGDKFRVLDLPKKYSQRGIFQVTDVSHQIEGMQWATSVEGQFRVTS